MEGFAHRPAGSGKVVMRGREAWMLLALPSSFMQWTCGSCPIRFGIRDSALFEDLAL